MRMLELWFSVNSSGTRHLKDIVGKWGTDVLRWFEEAPRAILTI